MLIPVLFQLCRRSQTPLMTCWNHTNKVIFSPFMYSIFQGVFVENFILKKYLTLIRKKNCNFCYLLLPRSTKTLKRCNYFPVLFGLLSLFQQPKHESLIAVLHCFSDDACKLYLSTLLYFSASEKVPSIYLKILLQPHFRNTNWCRILQCTILFQLPLYFVLLCTVVLLDNNIKKLMMQNYVRKYIHANSVTRFLYKL